MSLTAVYSLTWLLILNVVLVSTVGDPKPLDWLFPCQDSSIKTDTDSNNWTQDSSLLKPKGYLPHLIYNRVPKSASTTLRHLFRDQAAKRGFTILNKEIYVPFLLPLEVQQEVAFELESAKSPVLYERHMYFINFDVFQKPQPVYINIIRDPLEQLVSAYYYSREVCVNEQRCYFDTTFLNETLDQCVERRPVSECVDASQGISSSLPFFCGNELACEQNKTFALQKAKENIATYYTVVGVVEELYNFLFVLEHVLPKYFANIRLAYTSDGVRKENVRHNRSKNNEPSETTKQLLRSALDHEYDLYEFIKSRFHAQLQQILRGS